MSQIVIPKQPANKNREELLADAASGLLGLTISARVEISRKEKGRRDRIHLYSDIGATEKLVTIQCKELYRLSQRPSTSRTNSPCATNSTTASASRAY